MRQKEERGRQEASERQWEIDCYKRQEELKDRATERQIRLDKALLGERVDLARANPSMTHWIFSVDNKVDEVRKLQQRVFDEWGVFLESATENNVVKIYVETLALKVCRFLIRDGT